MLTCPRPLPVAMSTPRTPAALFACALAGIAGAQQAIEVSKDGHLTAAPCQHPAGGWVSRASGVPYPTTADWGLNLRRQVGAVRIADLNNDNLPDLFVGCFISNSFPPYTDWEDMIFYNTGNAAAPFTQTPGWISSDEVHTGDAQLADINRDGLTDILAISGGTSFSPPRIYFGSATTPATTPGWISTPPVPGWATSGTLFDVDNDNDLDLITTNQGVAGSQPSDAWRAMYLFFNNGSGLSSTPGWQSAELSIQNTTAAADYDNDGDLDIAVTKWANFETAVYRNSGSTLETNPAWTTGSTTTDRGVAWGDVDGDNDPDLATGIGGSGQGTRIWANTAGTLTSSTITTPPFNSLQEIALTDVDNDDDLDLVEVHFGDGRTHVYLNTTGTLAGPPAWTFDASEVANAIAVGDVNGDGWKDLVVGYSGNTSVRLFLARPKNRCDSVDFNNDGVFPDDADLATFIFVQGGGTCAACNDPDFNNDGVFPDDADLATFLLVLGGGNC